MPVGFVAQIASPPPVDRRRDRSEEKAAEQVPHDELESVQRGAEGARLADDVAESGHAVAWHADWQARTQPDLLGRSNPVLPEHQVPVRPALAPGAWHGAKPAAAGQAGLASA